MSSAQLLTSVSHSTESESEATLDSVDEEASLEQKASSFDGRMAKIEPEFQPVEELPQPWWYGRWVEKLFKH